MFILSPVTVGAGLFQLTSTLIIITSPASPEAKARTPHLVRLIVLNKYQVIGIKTKLFGPFDKPVYKLFTYSRSS
jgi:hypothetical protein